MRAIKKQVTMLACSAAVAALAGSAVVVLAGSAAARPSHRHVRAVPAPVSSADWDQRNAFLVQQARSMKTVSSNHRDSRRRSSSRARVAAQSHANSAYGGFTNNSLVAEARKYIGTNPTGRSSLWCGAFMDMVLKRTGHEGGGNLASAYARYGTRVSGPKVGAIAVMGRHGGGHVGIVSGVDANGNPIIVSGNHNDTVAESVYPRSRISAYVMPN
jgi:uncharacterized protein (TIGR02594 family)